jgi:hypothetical protein
MMGFAVCILHWTPAEFWESTPHEFHAAAEALAELHNGGE